MLRLYSSWNLYKAWYNTRNNAAFFPQLKYEDFQLKQEYSGCNFYNFFLQTQSRSYLKEAYHKSPTKSITCSTQPLNIDYSKALKTKSNHLTTYYITRITLQQVQTEFSNN